LGLPDVANWLGARLAMLSDEEKEEKNSRPKGKKLL
jgi:hypothetical protein